MAQQIAIFIFREPKRAPVKLRDFSLQGCIFSLLTEIGFYKEPRLKKKEQHTCL